MDGNRQWKLRGRGGAGGIFLYSINLLVVCNVMSKLTFSLDIGSCWIILVSSVRVSVFAPVWNPGVFLYLIGPFTPAIFTPALMIPPPLNLTYHLRSYCYLLESRGARRGTSPI